MKTGTTLGLLAVVLALACGALWAHQIRQVDIPENRTAFVVVFLTAAGLGVGAFVKGAGWVGGVAAVGAIVVGSLVPFTMAISRQEAAVNVIRVGDRIPRFTAPDDRGQPFESESLRGRPVLIKFFRGHW